MPDPMHLQFRYADFDREQTNFRELAGNLLEPGAEEVLQGIQRNLAATKTLSGEQRWELTNVRPLRTRPSREYYRAGKEKGDPVIGQIEFVWAITPISREQFAVTNKASTRVRLLRENGDEIAMWRVELGAAEAPGCYFHAQVLGESAACPFPSSVPIPRLPVFLGSPISVAEFLLGELFQGQWAARLLAGGSKANVYGGVQRSRWKALLNWQLDTLDGSTGLSPWLALKHETPAADLFVSPQAAGIRQS